MNHDAMTGTDWFLTALLVLALASLITGLVYGDRRLRRVTGETEAIIRRALRAWPDEPEARDIEQVIAEAIRYARQARQ